MSRVALVAVGGNALITDKHHPEVQHQVEAVKETCRHLADMIEAGWRLIVTHGNGPQVGFILRRNELAAPEVHPTPLDVIGADTQGAIGYMIQQALRNELARRGRSEKVVAVVTQVQVDKNDPGFTNPTKPIGGFMDEETARAFESQGWQVVEDAGRGWRRVVASPIPERVVEQESIEDLIAAGNIVVAVGGGGIPVIEDDGVLKGVYAVIDKDRASSLLATSMNADLLMISTAVEKVSLNFNTPDQKDLDSATVAEMKQYMAEGHFAPGSMKPKIEACVAFVEATGQKALITDPPNMARAIAGETGTWITP